MPKATLHVGDAKETLSRLPESSVQCCVTSPPYWGLRDYGEDGQLGLEETPEQYVNNLCDVFDEVRRLLRDDGTVWLNLGDTYARPGAKGDNSGYGKHAEYVGEGLDLTNRTVPTGLKEKDLTMIPSRVAMELQRRGWWVRSRIVWAKGNPMPESVTDRPTSSHEYIFLFSPSKQYYYDADAIREDNTSEQQKKHNQKYAREYKATTQSADEKQPGNTNNVGIHARPGPGGRNKRDVWQVNTKPFPDAHFAVYPPDLIEPCIKAGTSKKGQCACCGAPWERIVEKGEPKNRGANEKHHGHLTPQGYERDGGSRCGDVKTETKGWQPTCDCNASDLKPQTVLDPFSGAGTTGVVALAKGRDYIGIDLSRDYTEMAADRIRQDAPLMNKVEIECHA